MMESKNIHILIVEDEVLIAERMRRHLQLAGYKVHDPVTTGAAAIASVTAHPPDILVMDIRLPMGMSGIQAAHEIRAQHNIPIVFMTGYSDTPTLSSAQQLKPVAILEKPIFPHQLTDVIDAAIAAGGAASSVAVNDTESGLED